MAAGMEYTQDAGLELLDLCIKRSPWFGFLRAIYEFLHAS
jgi:hypothetical protein